MKRIHVHVVAGRCAAIAIGVLAMLVVGVHPAGATHFYGGATSWQRELLANPTDQTITFTVDAEWRSSFTGYTGGANPPVGRQIIGLHVLNVSGAGYSNSVNMDGVVTDVMPFDDRFVTHSVVTIAAPTSAFPITVDMSGCCRISSLREGNADQNYRLTTVVDIAKATRSPQYTGALRAYLQTTQPASFPLPGLAFEGTSRTTVIAPSSASFLASPRPVGIAACGAGCASCYGTDAGQCVNGLSVSPANVVSWTPQTAGQYGVQFALTGVDAGNVPRSSVPVDMIVDVRGPCPTCPVVSAPATASVAVGATLSLPVTVTNPDGSIIGLAASGLPATATLTNPLNATLQWTPVAGDIGPHTVCFQATNYSDVPLAPTCTVITVTSAAPALCVPGSYSATGSAPCTPCAAGTFTTATGQTACTPCATCAGGAYPASACTATQDTTCGTCDASCTTCDGPSATDCTSCPTDTPPVAGACLPDICAPGSYSATGSAPCTPCPAGFFADALGQTSCTPCAPGTFAAAAGQLLCTACAAGTFAAFSGQVACDACSGSCDAGEYEASACTATQDTTCGTCDASCTTCGGPTPADCTSCPTATPPVDGTCLLPGCSAAPAAGCRPPEVGGKSKLDLKDSADDAKDSLKWKWSKGTATLADFGDPTTTDDWYLCIYDDGTRVSATALPAGDTCAGKPCWAAKSTGFVYKDKELTPDGAQGATLKAGAAEKASISVTAKGAPLEMPSPATFTGPVRVQLQRGDRAVCFENTFSAPFKKNLDGTFSDADDTTVATTTSTIASTTSSSTTTSSSSSTTTTAAPTTSTTAVTTTTSTSTTTSSTIPPSCKELHLANPAAPSGVYVLRIGFTHAFAYCDMTTDGGGWTVFQRRTGASNFNRSWSEYSNGFGSASGDHWLGNERLFEMTEGSGATRELYVKLNDFTGDGYAKYSSFSIGSGDDTVGPGPYYFRMTVGPMTEGTIGDALSYHSGADFSTFDSDHDTYSGPCAGAYGGGWWYKACYSANLNGPYVAAPGIPAVDAGGIDWLPWRGRTQSMASTVMMIR